MAFVGRPLWCIAWRTLAILAMLMFAGAAVAPAQDAAPKAKAKSKAKSKAAGPKLDLSYLPPNTVAAALMFPKRSLAKPEAQKFPLEALAIWSRKELGIDLTTVEQALFAVRHDGKSEEQEPMPLVVVRADKPFDKAVLLQKLQLASEPTEVAGKSVYEPVGTQRLAALFPDDRTLILAPPTALPTKERAAAQTGELFTRLRAAAGKEDLVAVVALEPVRELIDSALAKRPPPPAPVNMFLELRNKLNSVELRASVLQPSRLQLMLHADSSESAGNVEGAANMALALGRMGIAAQMQKEAPKGDDPELDMAMKRWGQRMVDDVFTQLKPKRTGNDVVMEIEGEGGAASVGLLVGLTLPAVQAAREAARRIQSMNNLRQLAIAMHVYQDANSAFPPAFSVDDQGKPLLSWRVQVLPFIEQQELYKEFHLDEPWDSEHNKKLIRRMPAVFATPNRPNDGKTAYLVPLGQGTIFGDGKGPTTSEIRDGTSNTILIVEADDDRAVEWTRPGDLEFDPARPLAGLGHVRKGGFLAALADASVRLISDRTPAETLQALFEANDGKDVDLDSPGSTSSDGP
jgi:type II secretory pathway pseudopilin PulG